MNANFTALIAYVALLPVLGQQIQPIRDLGRYRQATPYVLNTDVPESLWSQDLAIMRQFVWSSLDQHELALAKVTFVSLEGYTNMIELFVEPDKRGNWIVNIEEAREHQQPNTNIPSVVRKARAAYSLAWISKGTQAPKIPTSRSDMDFFEHHKLQLLDDHGKLLLEL